jgi:hypothetical protein
MEKQLGISKKQAISVANEREDAKTSENPVICPWEGCGRMFRARFLLNRHMLIHTKEKRYFCSFCDKSFTLAQHYKEHTSIHTGEFPYECGVNGCKERFRQGGKLSLHRRTHPEYKLKHYNYSLNPTKKSITHPRRTHTVVQRNCDTVEQTEMQQIKRDVNGKNSTVTISGKTPAEASESEMMKRQAKEDKKAKYEEDSASHNDEANQSAATPFLQFIRYQIVADKPIVLPLPNVKLRDLKNEDDSNASMNLFALTMNAENAKM